MTPKSGLGRAVVSASVVFLSTASSVGLTQMAEQIVDFDSFAAIAALVWFSFSFLVFFFPVYVVFSSLTPRCRHQTPRERCRKALTFNGQRLTWRQYFLHCGLLSTLLTLTLYLLLQSMKQLAPADVFAILSAHNCLHFLISWIVLQEPFLVHRFAAFLIGTIGMIHFVYIDGFQSPTINSVLYSGLAAGCFTVERIIKRKMFAVQHLDQSAVLLSLCASLVLLMLWLPPVILHVTGAEILRWEQVPWSHVALFVVAVMLFMVTTGLAPLLCTWQTPWVGMGLALPINAMIDLWFRDLQFPAIRILAYAYLLLSCLLYLLPANFWERLRCSNNRTMATVAPSSLTRRYWNAPSEQ